MPYKYRSPVKIHFDINIDNSLSKIGETELNLEYAIGNTIPTNELPVLIRWRLRLKDRITKIPLGSYVSEQEFFLNYSDDDSATNDITDMFRMSQNHSQDLFDEFKLKNNLKIAAWSRYNFPNECIQDVLNKLREIKY